MDVFTELETRRPREGVSEVESLRHRLAASEARADELTTTLREAREAIAGLRDEVEKLSAPPSAYAVYLAANPDGTVNILANGRKLKVCLRPSISAGDLRPGQELVLNEALNVVAAAGYEMQSEVVILRGVLD